MKETLYFNDTVGVKIKDDGKFSIPTVVQKDTMGGKHNTSVRAGAADPAEAAQPYMELPVA